MDREDVGGSSVMLTDPDKGVVYLPISEGLLARLGEWSDPVRFRVERLNGELSLVFEKLELRPVELSKGRAA